MAFANVTLLIGGLLIAIPLVLHLLMRQQPKHQVFPALRFLKQRRESNRRKLRLRHWLLLLLRCLAIALLALALAQPSVASATLGNWVIVIGLALLGMLMAVLAVAGAAQKRSSLVIGACGALALMLLTGAGVLAQQTLRHSSRLVIGDQQAPVAAVLVLDTSLRMQYLHENRTRLEHAKEMALWLVGHLPAESEVAVVDARPQPLVFAADLAAARDAIARLEPSAVARPLPAVIDEALQLARTSSKQRKEIYVFTDMTAQAWSAQSPERLQRRLEDSSDTLLYVVNVGVENAANISLGDISLSPETVTQNGEVQLESFLAALGTSQTATVELHVEEQDLERPVIRDGKVLLPTSRRRARQVYELKEGERRAVQLVVGGFPAGVHHGSIRLVGTDGLAIDNTRYFTFQAQEAPLVLVAAPPDVNTFLFTEVIAPYELRMTEQARFRYEVVEQSQVGRQDLSSYAAVCLLDPQPMTSDAWRALRGYIAAGGQMALFLGHNAQLEEFNKESAQQVLPAPLARQWRSASQDLYLAPQSFDHPILAPMSSMATQIPWDQFPVFRHWQLGPLDDDAFVVLRYGNGQAAIVEQGLASGRVVLMTTPITEPARPRGWQPWNQLASASDWPRFMLVNQIVDYLVSSGSGRLTVMAGEELVLPNDPHRDPLRYQLFTPQNEITEVTADDEQLLVRFTEYPGSYRLKGSRDGEVLVRGFSVNVPAEVTDLRPLPEGGLDQVLGPDRYKTATDTEELRNVQGRQRAGRQFYPFLILCVALVMGIEHLLASRFYPDEHVGV